MYHLRVTTYCQSICKTKEFMATRMCHELFVYQIMKLLMPLFFLVFLQLDRFPVELAVPDFLAQRIISAPLVPAFLQR